ncbi:MAG: Protein of unknown function zinc binding 2 [Proteobacteria bacterium]|nr:Protein of unknown function zinc binding 2 [Pseudomonadota bacterium]
MRMDDQRESDNVEDRRGSGFAARRGGIGIGGIVVALAVSYFLGVSPSTVLSFLDQSSGTSSAPQIAQKPPADDRMAQFVSKVLSSTEDTWREVFRKSGKQYQDPKLVLFTGSTPTACGTGEAATGPFYCPGDQKVYIDLAFFRELKDRFKAPGEFAQAYVIAHEVGHHVQEQLGISARVQAARQRGSKIEANAMLVRLELQADCFAGVWGKSADTMKKMLEPGEIEQALAAASAIGDDRLQQQSRGVAVPETFTHGSSAQRVRWFKRGFDSGSPQQCDTFKAAQL